MDRPRCIALAASTLLLFAAPLASQAPTSPAEAALLQGRADDATRLLQVELAVNPADAHAHLLLCRVRLSEELHDAAVPECDAAAIHAPQDSDTQLWLGRAYGAKAAATNPLYAFPLARKVHAAFERAVELNPDSGPALSDLGEFYVQAPAIVGGGLDKARRLAAHGMAAQPARAHRLLAEIAEQSGDLRTAEAEFRDAGHTPTALIDLAQFYLSHDQPDTALSTIQAALAEDHLRGPELVDAGIILTKAKRAPELAQLCFEQYLASPARSDAAPAFRVQVELGNLLYAKGDTRGAAARYALARGLASAYAGAQRSPGHSG